MSGSRSGRSAALVLCCAVGLAVPGLVGLAAAEAVAPDAGRFDPPLRLGPEDGVVEVAPYLWYREEDESPLPLRDVLAEPGSFRRNEGPIFNAGTSSEVLWIGFDLVSTAPEPRSFVVSMDRATVDTAAIDLVRGDEVERLLADTEAARAESLARFRTLAAEFELAPGERASLLLRFRGANWSALRMTAATADAFETDREARLAVFLVVMGAVATLVVYGSLSFVFLGAQIVLLYAAAQIAFFVFAAHMTGYTAAYLWPESPGAGRIVSPASFAVLMIASAQFGRVFFETGRRALAVDRILAGCVAVGTLALGALLLDPFVAGVDRRIPTRILYALAIVCWSVLPALAIHATLRWSRDYWPTAVAWSSMALMVLWLIAVFTGLVTTIPLGKRSYNLMVFIEASLLAVAIALRIRRLREAALDAQQRLTESLLGQLAESRRARRLADERSWALQDLVEKGRLLVAAGHDSRQMVGALRLYAAGLRRRATPDDVDEAARGIEEVARNLDDVLGSVMAGSASGGIGDRTLALDTITASSLLGLLGLIHERAARDKGIDLRVHPSDCALVTDRVLVMRVLGNLVSNAVKYTDAGAVLIGLRRRGDGCSFQVWDTGRGIDPAALELLSSPGAGAVRLDGPPDGPEGLHGLDGPDGTLGPEGPDDRQEGSGSGLGIARSLASRLGGSLTARSRPGRGSVFELHLPQSRKAGAEGRGRRAILLEGDGGRDGALAQAAASIGLALETAGTRAQAAPLLERADPGTLVLVDQHFGGADAGLAFARELGARRRAPEIALLSYDRSSEARAKLAEGAHLVLYKPVTALALAAAVRRLAAPPSSGP